MAGERGHTIISGAVILIDGTSIGFTSGASKIAHTVESVDITANQSLLPIKSVKSGEKATVTFGALEMKRENLKIFFESSIAIETSGDHRILYAGGDQDLTEHYIDIYCRAEDDKLRRWTILKCVRDGDIAYEMDTTKATVMELTYKALADLSKAEGKQLLKMDDDTATAYDKDTGL